MGRCLEDAMTEGIRKRDIIPVHTSDLGISCPSCGYLNEPDNAEHYSESFCEFECGSCGCKMKVEVLKIIKWRTSPKRP